MAPPNLWVLGAVWQLDGEHLREEGEVEARVRDGIGPPCNSMARDLEGGVAVREERRREMGENRAPEGWEGEVGQNDHRFLP